MNNHDDFHSEDGAVERDAFIHDLKNIMTGALGHLSLIRKRYLNGKPIDESIETVEGILKGACRLAENTLRAGERSSEEQEMSLVDIVSACGGICIPPEGVTFRVSYGRNLPSVKGDPVRYKQLFNNLLTNAVQAMAGRGRIEVEIDRVIPDRRSTDSPMLEVRVIDSGPGVSAENRENVFAKGFTTRVDGSGMGLYAAKVWLEAIEGSIGFEDFPEGEGCCVVMRIPGSELIDARTIPPEPVRKSSLGRVLVLEDDAMVARILDEMLEQIGCEMVETRDGRKTVEVYRDALASENPFCAVILDLNVPSGFGGVETARRIKEIDHDARLFVSSGFDGDEAMLNPHRLGFTGKLGKPFSLQELAEIVRG